MNNNGSCYLGGHVARGFIQAHTEYIATHLNALYISDEDVLHTVCTDMQMN